MPVTSAGEAVASPCINICTLDPATQICVGCYRHIDEIAGWGGYSNAERASVVRALAERRQRYAFDVTTQTPLTNAPTAAACGLCGTAFICGMQANQGDCWCGSYPKVKQPLAANMGCLCPTCLASATQQGRTSSHG